MKRNHSSRRAFMVAETLWAITAITILITTMLYAAIQLKKTTGQLADVRTAARIAEESLIRLQTGQAPRDGVLVVDLSAAAPPAPPRRHWVKVTATHHGHAVSLTGLVPGGGGGGS